MMLSREGGVLNCRAIASVALYASIASLTFFRSRLGLNQLSPRRAKARSWGIKAQGFNSWWANSVADRFTADGPIDVQGHGADRDLQD